MERDDALTELEILKEKLDKALYSTQKTIEEKETAHKEYEKMLEKYDRYIVFWMSSCVGGDVMSVDEKYVLILEPLRLNFSLQVPERNISAAKQDRYIRGRQRPHRA